MKIKTIIFLIMFLAVAGARANNLRVSNVSVRARDGETGYVTFDISWENSWRWTNINHDAAWVFFKVQQEGSIEWHHVVIEGSGLNPPGFSPGQGTAIEMIVPEDRVGFFLRRSGEGAGTLLATNVQAVWNFAESGMNKRTNAMIQALAIEMVYVAEGSFYLGSGGTEKGSFTDGAWEGTDGATPTIPFPITSEDELLITNAQGHLWGTIESDSISGVGGAGILPGAFPKGYAAFYCMKYDITQGQYTDFLNLLTQAQALTCKPTSFSTSHGYTIDGDWPNITNGAPDRSCNYLQQAHGGSFLDWAGMRPMTELEFEKACRGPLDPVPNEYAWGDIAIISQAGHSGAYGSGTETATPTNANCNTGGIAGPIRAGIYAREGSTRRQAGASYWGIMELSGNLYKLVVTVKHANGRAFTGLHGDGVLGEDGFANVPGWNANVLGWPADASNTYICRGGARAYTATYGRVSDRSNYYSRHAISDTANFHGWRGVRTAPQWLAP